MTHLFPGSVSTLHMTAAVYAVVRGEYAGGWIMWEEELTTEQMAVAFPNGLKHVAWMNDEGLLDPVVSK